MNSLEEFKELVVNSNGGPVPFVYRLPNDIFTPVSIFSNIYKDNEYAFLLESVEKGQNQGRYSFMGCAPRKVYSCKNGEFCQEDLTTNEITKSKCTDPLEAIKPEVEKYQAKWSPDIELPPFIGGLIGYLGYDCVHYFEPVGDWLDDQIDLPEMFWMLTDIVVGFDHVYSEIFLSKCILPHEYQEQNLEQVYKNTLEEIERFIAKYFLFPKMADVKINHEQSNSTTSSLQRKDYQDKYEEIVKRAKDYVTAGDIFQVVPSQRYEFDYQNNAFNIYRRLRNKNPSPYMFALKLKDFEAVGSSPETQLRCENNELMMRPLAGTRKKSGNRKLDEELANELLNDEKECAEHRMLVDLVRNDLGKVAKVNSVEITRLLEVEHYSHVMHLTSEVIAQLAEDKTIFDAIRATFPAGTLSGAPKVRAMQIINEFEDVRRNLYGGLVGYFDFAANFDSCIAIRMMVAKGDKVYVQAGAGLVADSDPSTEYFETVAKASVVYEAIERENTTT